MNTRVWISLVVLFSIVVFAGYLALVGYNVPFGSPELVLPEGVTIQTIAATDTSCEQARLAVDSSGCPLVARSNVVARLKRADSDTGASAVIDEVQRIDDICWVEEVGTVINSGHELFRVTDDGLELVLRLPGEKMRIAPAGPSCCYLYGGSARSIYRFDIASRSLLGPRITLQRLLELVRFDSVHASGSSLAADLIGGPVSAVAGDGTLTFFAIGRTIFSMTPGRSLRPIYQAEHPVRSLAVGPNSVLFFATTDDVGVCTGPGEAALFMHVSNVQLATWRSELVLMIPRVGIAVCSPAERFERMPEALELALEEKMVLHAPRTRQPHPSLIPKFPTLIRNAFSPIEVSHSSREGS